MNQEQKTKKVLRTIYFSILCVVLFFFSCVGIYRLIPSLRESISTRFGGEEKVAEKNVDGKTGTDSFSFIGVGDNIIYGPIYYWQGIEGGTYDFDDVYSVIAPYAQNADLSYISGETICAGSEFGYASYPLFNGPIEIIDAVAHTGFDWMAVSSEHVLDAGVAGLDRELTYINEKYPEMTYTGTNLTEEESETAKVLNVNGVKVGIQSYCFTKDNYSLSDDQKWKVNSSDKTKIEDDIDILTEVSDVQIVSVHWGTEFETEVDANQEDLAQFLNDLGVDVIIGSHPHLLQRAEFIRGEEGDTLCYYSLGNFLSCQDQPQFMIGGMASFTINFDHATKKVSWDNVKLIPTITYFDSEYRTIKAMTINEYDDAISVTHKFNAMNLEFINAVVEELVGNPEGIEVVYK
ncbi:MAG: CapA family protein [Firmicutes bacterium]|nr:CapA family protein [Bacillota bacterium]